MDEDYDAWIEARELGRHEFISRLALQFGVPLGLVLAVLAALAQLAGGDTSVRMLVLESVYFVSAAPVVVASCRWLEWRHLEKRFGRT